MDALYGVVTLLIIIIIIKGKGPSMSDITKDRSPYWLVCQSNTVYYTTYTACRSITHDRSLRARLWRTMFGRPYIQHVNPPPPVNTGSYHFYHAT